LSKPSAEHKVYPYLLRDKRIEKPNEVWTCDITDFGVFKFSENVIGNGI
jgi:hypothetical protein